MCNKHNDSDQEHIPAVLSRRWWLIIKGVAAPAPRQRAGRHDSGHDRIFFVGTKF